MRQKKRPGQFQVPLMLAFRQAFDAGDAAKRIEERVAGERVIAGRGLLKRRGADEIFLKKNLAIDLMSLMNTIDLESALDLSGCDHVKRSILNFGLSDISSLTSEEARVSTVGEKLRDALLHHEPRLRAESLRVEKEEGFDEVAQRVRFNVSAEMACEPLDVPMEFVAEVDVGSGVVRLTRLPIQS